MISPKLAFIAAPVLLAAVWAWALVSPKGAKAPVAQEAPAAKRLTAKLKAKRPAGEPMDASLKAAWDHSKDDDSDDVLSKPIPAGSGKSDTMGGDVKTAKAAPVFVDAGTLKTVTNLARARGACRSGSAKACATLDGAGGSGRLQLAKMLVRLATACQGHQLSACKLRGDLEMESLEVDAAATYFEQAKQLAVNVKSRCDDQLETHPPVCKEANETLRAVAGREAQIVKLRQAH